MSAVLIYARGMLSCSVCAPADMTRECVEAEVNKQIIAGTTHGWQISVDNFKGGETNGFENFCGGLPTHHWFLEV